MAQGRVEVNSNLNLDNRLQPQRQAVDTFAQPERAPTDQNLERLAQALAGFSNTLGNYEQVAAYKQNKAAKQTLELQQAKIGGMTRQQIEEGRAKGTLAPSSDPLTIAGIDASSGQRLGAIDSDSIQQKFKTEYDPSKDGSPRDYITKLTQEATKDMGPVMATHYLRQTNPLFDWADGYVRDQANKKTSEDAHAAGFTLLSNAITSGIKAGQDAPTIAKTVRDMSPQLGTSGFLGQQQDDIYENILGAARDAVGANPDAAAAIVSDDQYGFLKNPKYADRAQAVIAAAQTQKQKMAEIGWRNSLGALGGAAILDHRFPQATTETEGLRTFNKNDGSQVTVSAEDFNKKAVSGYLAASPEVAQKRNESPEQQLAREYFDINAAGQLHPKLLGQVKGIAAQLNGANLTDPEEKVKVIGRLKTGQWMLNAGQNTFQNYASDEADRNAVSIFDTFKNFGQNADGSTYSDEQAANATMEIVNPAIKANTNFTQDDQQSLDSAMGSIMKGEHWYNWDASPANSSAIRTKVEYLARGFIAHGNSHEDAIKMAVSSVQKSSLIYNGVMLPKVNGFQLDEDFKPTVRSWIDDWAKANPKTLRDLGITPDDIAIYPVGNVNGNSGGKFALILKDGLGMISDDNHNLVTFGSSDLRDKREADKKARDKAAINKAASK